MRFLKTDLRQSLATSLVLMLLMANMVASINQPVEVYALNYVEANKSSRFDRVLAKGGSFNNLLHGRVPVPFDTGYQSRVF